MLYSMYPSAIRRWIASRGGLTPHMIFLRGRELQSMYRPCYLDAQASTNRTPIAPAARPPVVSPAAASSSAASHCAGFQDLDRPGPPRACRAGRFGLSGAYGPVASHGAGNCRHLALFGRDSVGISFV